MATCFTAELSEEEDTLINRNAREFWKWQTQHGNTASFFRNGWWQDIKGSLISLFGEAEILMAISTEPFETDKCIFIWRYPVELSTD